MEHPELREWVTPIFLDSESQPDGGQTHLSYVSRHVLKDPLILLKILFQ